MILHCVFCNFLDDTSIGARSALLTELSEFAKGLDGVLAFDHGANLDFEHKSPDHSDGFIVRFENRASLAVYADHPDHKAFGARLCAMCNGGADGIVVYDIAC